MNIRCALYKSLFWFKQQKVATVFFGGRGVFQVLKRNVVVRGVVLEKPSGQVDGDDTFNFRPDVLGDAGIPPHPVMHAEVTPCTIDAIRPVLAQLVPGAYVEVEGDYCYDPPHAGGPEHWEIHPVRHVTILAPVLPAA